MNEPLYRALDTTEQQLLVELLRKFLVHNWADSAEEDLTAQRLLNRLETGT